MQSTGKKKECRLAKDAQLWLYYQIYKTVRQSWKVGG
jgi:hypothetical protein